MYAIANIKGFQYKVQKGDKVRVPRYDAAVGDKLSIAEVLMVSDDKSVKVGTPFVEHAEVKATVSAQDRYDKVTVFKKKRRKDYSVKRGHHQDFTELVIDDIVLGKAKKAAAKSVKAETAETKDAAVETAAEGTAAE